MLGTEENPAMADVPSGGDMTDRLGVIGLGEMGSALAGALLQAGFSTCVWNRTADKARPIADAGAVLADSPADAAAKSDVLVVCVSNYEIADSLLREPEAEARLKGKTIVQLTTGTPTQGREASAWADALGAEYLDGSIMAFPSQIGTDEALILVCGRESSYEKTGRILEALATQVVYLGTDAGRASALDQALLSSMLGLIVGVVSGVRVCEAENIPVEQYSTVLAALMPTSTQEAQRITERIAAGDLRETEAALKTWAGGVDHMITAAGSGGGSDEFPTFLQRLFRRAIDAGYGDYDIAALIEVLRKR
jgi:3-hydroxyisobutyrate dehydrogenase-like beta-hydroxyacid dehydrogenase